MFTTELTYEEGKRSPDEWTGGLRRGTVEWRAAWRGLAAATGDTGRVAQCPVTGERWQYVCSFRDRGRWTHEFRHRHHPVKRRRWYVHVEATVGWKPEDDKPPTVH